MMEHRVEILSPGGDIDAVKAAVLAGADAVYMGMKKFNARKRAENITSEQLADLINIAHSRNVKIFITMNILLTEKEIPEAVETVAELINQGVDAIIVQDIGFAYLLEKYFPALEVHASTQMTTHNSLQIDFIKKFGIKQLNFARELSKEELIPLIEHTKKQNLKSEIFVHGAYCISCSGICYMSAFMAAQPGNRGACLQPCRRRYSTNEKSEKKYLLSLKDNNAFSHAGELLEIKADTLKIEGRIKGFNYVYQVTSAWHRQTDALYNNETINSSLEENVKKVFNRDFSAGYFEGSISSRMFIDSPLDQSLRQIGKVDSYTADKKLLIMNDSVELEESNRINIYTSENLFICGAVVKKKINTYSFEIEIENQLKGKIQKGQLVMLLENLNESERLKKQLDLMKPSKKILNVKVKGKNGEKLLAEFSFNGKTVITESETLLSPAEKNSLTGESLSNQFSRLGDTQFELGDIDIKELEDGLFIPVKELNRMRREAVENMLPPVSVFKFNEQKKKNTIRQKKLALLISDTEDMDFIDSHFEGFVFLETGTSTKLSSFKSGIYPWIPAFITNAEIPFYEKLINELDPEIIVSDNSGIGSYAGDKGIKWIAGPQLNSSNGYSFEAYQNKGQAAGAFYSSEINREQINQISVPDNFTTFLNVFGNILLMTTRQCLFQKPGLCPAKKTQVDKHCLKGCSNYTEYFDEMNVPFHITKTPGFIHRIFNDASLFIPEAVTQTNADYYLLDFRSFPFFNLNKKDKITIYRFFNNIIRNGVIDKQQEKLIKEILKNTTRGNYTRGFEE